VTDVTLRRVLARIEESYVEPGRLDPGRMLDGANRGARLADASVLTGLRGRPERLVAQLAPELERALAGVGAAAVNPLRATMLTGALRCLDRYSSAVSGEARRRLHERFAGSVGGIGVRIGRREGRIRVLRCLPGGSAEAAGVKPGDTLLAVGGKTTERMLVTDALRNLRGRPGTRVAVKLDRRPALELSIRRRRHASPGVDGRVCESGVGLLRLRSLNKATPAAVERWLASAAAKSIKAGLILDLRGNRGGSMLAAASVADRFVRRGILLEALDRGDRPVPGLAHRVDASDGVKPGWPIAVLQDQATCSAAELLAAAMAWNDRAILVGARTHGKNTILKLYPFEAADLTLRLAVAYMRTAGRRLSEQGLRPDIEVPGTSGSPSQDPGTPPVDPVLATARRLILDRGSPGRADWLARIARQGRAPFRGPSPGSRLSRD